MSELKYRVLRVFLASPSDLQEEREITREVVSRINTSIGRNLNVHVELRGWEDTPPTRRRPQDAINQELMQCDFFLGLVWRRWGMPPGGDNEYDSGFEEEYNLACELHDQGQLQEVAIYFKDMGEAFERDPGDQASKVIGFRESVKQNNEILFDKFDSAGEWEKLLYDHLSRYLTKNYVGRETEEMKHAPRRIPAPEEETDLVRVDASLAGVLEAFNNDEAEIPEALVRARAHLYTQSLVNGSVYRTTVHDSEELAFLYGAREQIELSRRECLSIFRTLLADDEKVKAGWYWLNVTTDQLGQLLSSIATQSPLYAARSHACDLLRTIDEEEYRRVIHEIADGGNIEETRLALGPFVENPEEEDRELLQTLVEEYDGDIAETAWRGILKLEAEVDVNQAVEWIIDTPNAQRGKYNDLLPTLLDEANSNQIRRMLTVVSGKNRAEAVEALSEELADGELRELAQDENLDVAAVALMELIERGEDVDDQFINDQLLSQRTQPGTSGLGIGALVSGSFLSPGPSIYSRREVLRACYRRWSRDQLEEGVEWSPNGALRYQVLIDEYHDAHGDQLRADIRNEFHRYETRTLAAIIQGQDPNQDDSFTLGCFYRAAFQVLVNHTRPDDVEIARDFLREPHESTDTRDIIKDAFQITSQHGGPDDIDLVWNYVTHDNIGVRRQATALVLNLDPERFQEHASALLNLDDWAVQEVVFCFALENDQELPREVIRQLLYNSESQTRRGALSYLVENMEDAEQRELLNNYPQTEDIDFDFYYYDVVGWLDRLLFAPEPIREYYREELTDTLDEENSLTFTD